MGCGGALRNHCAPLAGLNTYRLVYRHRREPVEAVWCGAIHDSEELMLQRFRDWPHGPLVHADFIDGAYGSNFRRGAAEENFVRNVEHLARNHMLHQRYAKI